MLLMSNLIYNRVKLQKFSFYKDFVDVMSRENYISLNKITSSNSKKHAHETLLSLGL